MSNDLRTATHGATGTITLARADRLHALNEAMCEAMIAALLEWRDDGAIAQVIIEHESGTRGFCAGGDVAAVRNSALYDGGKAARSFFFSEYRLNHLLHEFPKPLIAFMDGVTMGGGVGLCLPAACRIATQNTRFAMPEGAIGLFPDIGAPWYLAQLPGNLGKFLVLTGAQLDAAECFWAGLATHYLPADSVPAAKAALRGNPANPARVLQEFVQECPPARLEGNAAKIERLFAADTLEGIMADLAHDESQWAGKELRRLAQQCPVSSKVALKLFAAAPGIADFAAEMQREYAIAVSMIMRPDFAEGVRAVLIEKDKAPSWSPALPDEVTQPMLDAIFAPLPPGEEWTPLAQ